MKQDINNNPILRHVVIVIAIIVCAIGINGFLTPANLLATGLSGIIVILTKFFPVNQGLILILFNIPIFLLCRKYVNKQFLVSSLINMFIFSISLGLTQNLGMYINFNDIMIQSIFGGLINGVGIGILYKCNSSVGGLDFLTAVIKIKYNISIKNSSLIINFFVICLGGIFFGAVPAMYTIISMYLTCVAMDIAKDVFTQKKVIFLLSSKYEEISVALMDKLGKGVTFIEAEGAYKREKKKLIYYIALSSQIQTIKEIVYSIDETAFMSINDTDEVAGAGFKAKIL